MTPRTGGGFDVHRFDAPGSAESIMLGGVPIPHDRALIGHSDADVLLHALTDALLGALCAGDLGELFGTDDPAHAGRASSFFLSRALRIAASDGARIIHADMTLVGESPRIAPHRMTIRRSVAGLLGIPEDAVSVKATTTDGLGVTGRREGLAAHALLTLLMPPDGAWG